MRGIILWAAVGVAAIVTGLGLYATALQTSPATITNPPVDVTPAATVPPPAQPEQQPTQSTDHRDDDRPGGDDHDRDRGDD